MPGSTVLVLGCGPIGCFAVGVARAAGASLVIASDFNPMRLELARAMGAQVTLNPGTDDVVARVRELTGGDGVDLVCEMSGHPSGHAQAFAAARLGGRVNLLGTPSRTTEVDFARDVIFKGLTLYGVTGRKMYQTWHQMRRFLRAGQLDPRPVITHRFPLERIADAIQVIKDGQAGKVILEVGAMSQPAGAAPRAGAGAVHSGRGLQAPQLSRQPPGGPGPHGGPGRGHHPLLQQLPRA